MEYTVSDLYKLDVLLKTKGIYKVTNTDTNEFYIGSTIQSFRARFSHHLSDLKIKRHHCKKLQNYVSKHGVTSLLFTILEIVEDESKILEREEYYITTLKPVYNCIQTPTNARPNLNKKLSKEWKTNLHKNKYYKHNTNIEVYNRIVDNNKKGSNIVEVYNLDEFITKGTYIELAEYFNCTKTLFAKRAREGFFNDYRLVIVKEQKKRILLHISESEKIQFTSSLQCDNYLNMWRGATSFYLLRDGFIKGYKVEYIN